MSNQKITLGAESYEFVPAVVESVDYTSDDASRLFSVQCKFLWSGGSLTPDDLVSARALNSNIKHIPIVGEIVFVCKAPTPFHSGAAYGTEYYYTAPISIQSSVHHNGLPGANRMDTKNRDRISSIKDSSIGFSSKTSQPKTENIDSAFPERIDVQPIQPFSGDIIVEGRWGNSIRLGSTVDMRRAYPQTPNWGIGTGATGNPITIISNGTNPKNKTHNQFHIESPDDDDASIWLSSGQSIKFTPASSFRPSLSDKDIDLFVKNKFSGNQIILSSDRVIVNAKTQEIGLFSREGIGLSSEKVIAVNAKKIVEIESDRIALGINATSPVLLGDRVIELLAKLIDVIVDMNKSITMQTHPTGVGPSGIPLNSGDYVGFVNDLIGLRNSLPKTASRFVFVNDTPRGPSDSDKEKFNQIEQNRMRVKLPDTSLGDSSSTVSFENL